MHFKQFFVLSLICLAVVLVHQSYAACGSCQINGLACVNETSFNICYKNEPDTTQTFSCAKNEVCTSRAMPCFPKGTVTPACEISKNCGACDGIKMFTCISQTKYAQCNGTDRTEVKGTCPDGSFCRSTGGEICVSECLISEDGPECNSLEEV